MSDSINTSLVYLRDHTVEEAIRNNHLPAAQTINVITLAKRAFSPESADASRINTFVTRILERGIMHLEDADIPALRKVYNYLRTSLDQKNRISQICIQIFLKNISPELREKEAREMDLRMQSEARSNILEAMELIRREDHTKEELEDIIEVFQGSTPAEQNNILAYLKRLPGSARTLIVAAFLGRPEFLYQRFKRLDAKTIDLDPPPEEVHGEMFSLSVQPLLDKAEDIKKATTFDQLPREVNANTLRDLFQSLDRRLEALSPAAKQRALEEINGQIEAADSSYESLKNGMITDSYLQTLLQTTGPGDEKVPLDVMQLFRILQFILSQPNTLQGNQILTEREEVLVKTAGSIRGCSGGKKEGIFVTYNLMNAQPTTTLSSSREEVSSYIYSIIYQILSSLLSEDTPFMKALTNTKAMRLTLHLSHQAIYVKNLIGKRVGLVWDIFSDPSTIELSPFLVEKKPAEALKIFFRYFSPTMLTNALKEKINRDLSDMNSSNSADRKKATALYNLLYGLLDDAGYWESDPTISLKTEGTIKLLTTFGYLRESGSQITSQAANDIIQIFDGMKEATRFIYLSLAALTRTLEVKDISLQHALFERMYWHHVKTGKKRVEHPDYGRAAFLGTDPRLVVTKEEKQEVIRQVKIEYVLKSLKNPSEREFFLRQLGQIDKNIANRLYGKMFEALQRADKVSSYDYLGGGEAAFKKVDPRLKDEKIAAIDALVHELRAEWLPPEAR